MAASPIWKIYDAAGAYQAACHEAEAAACLVSFYGAGAEIRYAHGPTVWREGEEIQPAAESYDEVAATCYRRRTLFSGIRREFGGRVTRKGYEEALRLDRAAAVGAGLAKAGL